MAQLSRPYQIALVALLFAAVAWFGLGRLHHGSSEATSTTPAPAAPATHASSPSSGSAGAAAGEGGAAAPTPIYHGSAPGVEGLSRAINKAHGAVSTSQANAKQLEEKSAQAGSASSSTTPEAATSSPSAPPSTSSAPATATPPTTKGSHAHKHTTASKHTPASKSAPASSASNQLTSGQQSVESALATGKIPVVLFWNPSGADDVEVHGQVRQLTHTHLPIAIYEGSAESVAAYGAITRDVPVYGTPTILIVAPTGKTTALTGLQEDFSIEQAIEEARAG